MKTSKSNRRKDCTFMHTIVRPRKNLICEQAHDTAMWITYLSGSAMVWLSWPLIWCWIVSCRTLYVRYCQVICGLENEINVLCVIPWLRPLLSCDRCWAGVFSIFSFLSSSKFNALFVCELLFERNNMRHVVYVSCKK
jgi:hypothetical protein